MHTVYQTEAVVLQAVSFKDFDKILTLFSPEGVMKLFAKGSKKNNCHFTALTSPLTLGEFHYTLGKKDLHRLLEGSIVNQHIGLRARYEVLQAAEAMRGAILNSQWVGKPAPHLFNLFCRFLNYLPKAENPATLILAFYLKTLINEGVLNMTTTPAALIYRYSGELYSPQEAPLGALPFSTEEEALLHALGHCRSLSTLDTVCVDSSLQKKIEALFRQALEY